LWESLVLADNLPGLASLTDDTGVEQYTLLTLRAWTTENGPAPAERVVEWGLRLARALDVLHAADLVHRDVKPANILLLNGAPCLGDYGLVGEPGGSVDFGGTEGFRPIEGNNEAAADLFAVGKALYETWTANDRLEFPSLPSAVLGAPDWSRRGRLLNELILRACHAQPSQRFLTAARLVEALTAVLGGRRPLNRRRWLVATAAGLTICAGGFAAWRAWRPAGSATWRCVREKGFNVEGWDRNLACVDWGRHRAYSLQGYKNECLFQSVDLATFAVMEKIVENGPKSPYSCLLHPETKQLWFSEDGRGEVFALDLETARIKSLGGGPGMQRHFQARAYWNPVTRRVGIFGGYGMGAVRNDRSEFDAAAGRWIEVEPDRRDTELWPRICLPLVQDASGRRVFLAGGQGNPSGKQGVRTNALRAWNGQFYVLDDIWELDLEKNSWHRLLPIGHLDDPKRLRAILYHPRLQGLLIFMAAKLPDDSSSPAEILLLRPGVDRKPLRLSWKGQPSCLSTLYLLTVDPQTEEILILADDGIFRVSVELA
jgi:hypothetical protein